MSSLAVNPSSALTWYLVRTKPAAESRALVHLERQGYRVYFPRLSVPARVRGSLCERIGPLFPRYLFVGLEAGLQSLGTVTFTRGVAGIVRFGRDLAAVPSRVIEQIRLRADPASGLHRLESARIQRGVAVSVVSGAFDGLDGIFERDCGDARVVVLLKIMGQLTRVSLDAASVVKDSRAAP